MSQKSPFFAVNRPDGNFEIKGLRPATYTIAFIHENSGEQTIESHPRRQGRQKTVDGHL